MRCRKGFMEVEMNRKLNALRLERLKSGLTQHEAALLSGLSQTTISLFEREIRRPKRAELERLAEVYDTQPEALSLTLVELKESL